MKRPPGLPYPLEFHGPYYEGVSPSAEVMPTQWPAREVDPTGAEGPGGSPVLTGPGQAGWFTAEFGCTVWQSFESMAGTLSPAQWGMSSPMTKQRNHVVLPSLATLFGPAAANATAVGERAFKRQLYESMIGQMLTMKAQIESWRSQNTFGTVFWMYNDMWPTGGWGSIECFLR